MSIVCEWTVYHDSPVLQCHGYRSCNLVSIAVWSQSLRKQQMLWNNGEVCEEMIALCHPKLTSTCIEFEGDLTKFWQCENKNFGLNLPRYANECCHDIVSSRVCGTPGRDQCLLWLSCQGGGGLRPDFAPNPRKNGSSRGAQPIFPDPRGTDPLQGGAYKHWTRHFRVELWSDL